MARVDAFFVPSYGLATWTYRPEAGAIGYYKPTYVDRNAGYS